jgi:hypothetical protein
MRWIGKDGSRDDCDVVAWDLSAPCKGCPFLKSTPPERKGFKFETLNWMAEAFILGGNGRFLHSCHVTDPRVTDGGYNPNYVGPTQHCAGALLMMKKDDTWSGPAVEAMRLGKLDPTKLTAIDKVHSLRNLFKTIYAWAKKEAAE